jgi:hypothetical protein
MYGIGGNLQKKKASPTSEEAKSKELHQVAITDKTVE